MNTNEPTISSHLAAPTTACGSTSPSLVARFLTALAEIEHVSARTIACYRADLHHFTRFVTGEVGGARNVHEPIGQQVAGFLFYLRQQNYAVASIKRKVSTLRAFSGYLLSQKIIQADFMAPVRSPKLAKRASRLLDGRQIDRLLAAPALSGCPFPARDTLILELLCCTGIRGSEVVGLRPDNFDLQRGVVTVDRPGGKVEFALRPQAVAALKACLAMRTPLLAAACDRVLLNRLGRGLSERGIRRILDRYAQVAQLGVTINPNMCRRSFAAAQLAKGVRVEQLRMLLGHKNAVVTTAYSRQLKSGDNPEPPLPPSLRVRRAA